MIVNELMSQGFECVQVFSSMWTCSSIEMMRQSLH